jgi:hypothetical protein
MSNETASSPAPTDFVSSSAPATFVSSPPTAGLEDPQNIFNKQNQISDNLNKFQVRYARYLRCQNEDTARNVNDPPCDLNTIDNFSELHSAYDALYKSMDSINDAYPRQLTNNGVTNDTYDTNEIQIEKTYENVTEMQENLDAKLKYIQEQLKHKDNSPTRMLESRQLVNTLLIILVMCVVYYAFIEL